MPRTEPLTTTRAPGHWNITVEQLAQNVLKHYMDSDPTLFESCAAQYEAELESAESPKAARAKKWAELEELVGPAPAAAGGTGAGSGAGAGAA